jgi:hypothetical protein
LREGDGVHEGVEPAEVALDAGEDRRDLGVDADVTRVEHGAGQRGREFLHVFPQPIALVGEGQAHPCARQGLRDGPGNRALVGDAEHDAGLALEHGP